MNAIILLVCTLFFFNTSAQQPNEILSTLQQQIERDLPHRGNSSLFVFTDKAVYMPGEYIWFSGYLLGSFPQDTLIHTIYISLSDRYQKKITTYGRFLLKNGYAEGAIFIADSVSDDDYVLLAFTDYYLEGKSSSIFIKDIFIRSARGRSFSLSSFNDPSTYADDTLKLKYLITASQNGIASGANVDYLLYSDSLLVQKGSQKVNKKGEFAVDLPLSKEPASKKWNLLLNVSKDTLSQTYIFPLPTNTKNSNDSMLSLQENENKDSINISLRSLPANNQYYLFIYNSSGVLYKAYLYLHKSVGRVVLPVDSFPRGYLHVALFDQNSKKLSDKELLLPPETLHVSLETDSSTYHTRSKVTAKIKILDPNINSLKALFSLSCILTKRSNPNDENIISHYYSNVGTHPFSGPFPKIEKGLEGQVFEGGEKIRKPEELVLLNGFKVNTIQTDMSGHFYIPLYTLLSSPEENIIISLISSRPKDYTVRITEPDKEMDKHLASYYYPLKSIPVSLTQANVITEQEFKKWKNTLKEVIVTTPYDVYNRQISSPEEAPCGVWVCSCDHWKCMGCRPLLIPTPGKAYLNLRTGKTIIYKGCPEDQLKYYSRKIQGIHLPKEFPVTDSVFYNTDTDTELSSTLYWNPFLAIDKNGEATVSFYTDDLTGKFSIVMEGLSQAGPFHSDLIFYVK